MNDYDACLTVKWQKHMVRLNTGIEMACYEYGDKSGVPVMFIHGVTDGCVSWSQMVPEMADKGCYCVVIEYRGNGRTDKPDQGECGYTAELIAEDIIDFMDKFELPKVHVVGHSYGSLIAQVLAVKAPERFLSYTLIDGAVRCAENSVLLSVINGYDDFKGVEAYDDYMPETFVREWTDTSNEDENFRKATYEHAHCLPAVAWKNLMRGLIRFDSSEYIHDIKGNVLVIWGTGDDIFTKEDQTQLKAGLIGCDVRYVDVQGASHNGFWDSLNMVKKYAAVIDEYIKNI